MRTFIKSAFILLAIGLTGCQQMTSDSGALATKAAATYVANISRAFPQGSVPTGRGIDSRLEGMVYTTNLPLVSPPQTWAGWNSGWNQVANNGMYGNYLMYPNMADEVTRCDQMVDAIPEQVQNLDFLLATLERCLFRLTVHKSPVMNATWAGGGRDIANYAGYLNDYTRPAQYGQWSYGPYYQFLLSGQNGYVTPTF